MATFAELRNEAKALGIDIHGKPARELEAEIAKKKAAPEEPKEEKKKMGRKAAAVEEKVEKADGAGDVRIAALEEKVEAQAVIIRGCLAAMKAMAAEIGFELPKSLAKSAEVAEAVKEEVEEAPAPKKRGRPAKAKEEPKAAPKKEEAEDDDDEDEDEDEDEVVVDFSITEIEKADLARLQEIAAVINKAESSTVIEIIDNEKKLRKALLAWLKANAEVVVKDKAPEPVKDEKKASKKKEAKKAAKDEDEDDEDEDEDEAEDDEDEDDEDSDGECPDFCVKGAEIEIGFETDDDETEWCKAKVLKIHKTAADTLVLEGPNKGSEAEVPFDSMRAIKKKLKAGKK